MPTLFIYGTLRDPRARAHLLGRKIAAVPARLSGWRRGRVMIEGKVYPAIVPSRGSTIRGQTISVAANELRKLDEYETRAYRRKTVRLSGGGSAWTYLKRSIL